MGPSGRCPEVPDATAWRKVPFVMLTRRLLLLEFSPVCSLTRLKPSADRM